MTDLGTELVPTFINGKWTLRLPPHRAARPQWGEWTNAEGQTFFGWEVERIASMHANIRPGDIVYDIGTEEGDISALIATWLDDGTGGLCLFEPNPLVWPNVRAIFEGNHLPAPLECWVGFAGPTENFINPDPNDFYDDMKIWPECAYGPVIGDHGFCNLAERDDISSVRIDTFVRATKRIPNVITMDIEGSELHALEGAYKTLEMHRPLVYVSVHPEFMQNMYAQDVQDLYDYMAMHGYRSKILAVDHETHVAFWHPGGRELVFT